MRIFPGVISAISRDNFALTRLHGSKSQGAYALERLEGGFGDGAAIFCTGAGGTWDDTGQRHFVEADVQADCAGHEEVVMTADDGTEGSVWFSLVGKEFVEATGVAFDIKMISNDLHERGYNHGFCGDVGVESVFSGESLSDFVFGLATGIKVLIYSRDLI